MSDENDLLEEPRNEETSNGGSGGSGDNINKSLEGFLSRIENLEEDKKDIAEDIKLVKQEAVAAGFDRKMLQEMLKLRAMDAEKRLEQETLRDNYIEALDLL